MPKLCFLISNDYGGGIAQVIHSICKYAVNQGFDIILLSVFQPKTLLNSKNDSYIDTLGFENPVKEIPQTFIEWLNENRPDYLFINGCEEIEPAIPYIPQNMYVVYTVHDTADIYWKNAIKNQNCIDAFCSVSKVVENKCKQLINISDKCFIAYNGCIFPELVTNARKEQTTLLFLGGEKPFKGALDVIKLFKKLNRKKKYYKLYWCGNASDSFQSKIKKYNSKYVAIVFTGNIPHHEVFNYAAKSQILLMLSRVEPFGMATIEAMAMGCIPIAWDINTGTKEIIRNNENGLLVPLGDYQNYINSIEKVISDFEDYSKSAIAHARNNFSVENSWKYYENIISQLNKRKITIREHAGEKPPDFIPPKRLFQLLPVGLKNKVRNLLAINPKISFFFRDKRGI